LLNFFIVWLPVRQALASGTAQAYPGISWIVLILAFVVIPVAWPFAVVWLLQRAEKHGWIAVRAGPHGTISSGGNKRNAGSRSN
jgi:hypothetical protein